jgi:integrase
MNANPNPVPSPKKVRGTMKRNVVKRGRTYSYYMELTPSLARDCAGAPGKRSHRIWTGEGHKGNDCPRCGQALGEARLQRRPKWVGGFKTAKDAATERRRVLGILDDGADPFPKEIALRTFVTDRWVPHLKRQGKQREATVRRYLALLDHWVLPDLGHLDVAKIGVRHVQDVLDKVTEAGKAPRTVAHVRAATSAVFTQALRWQIITHNPVAPTEVPGAQAPVLRTPSFAEVRALIATALADTAEARTGAAVRRYAPALLLSGTTGLRRAEVLGLHTTDVDLDTGLFRVEQTLAKGADGRFFLQDPKTVKSRRMVKLLTDDDIAVIRTHKADQAARRLALGTEWNTDIPDLLFDAGDGSPIPPDAYTRWALRYFASHDLSGVRLHDLRHALASHLIALGVPVTDVAAYLGHSQVTTTLNTYAHAAEHHVDRVVQAIASGTGG